MPTGRNRKKPKGGEDTGALKKKVGIKRLRKGLGASRSQKTDLTALPA